MIVSRPVHPMSRNLVTLAIWAVTLCSIYGWSERLRPRTDPGQPKKMQPTFTLPPHSPDAIGRLLGSTLPIEQTPEGTLRERFLLAGVIADLTGRGAALIGIDGKAARPYSVGAELVPGIILHSVMGNQVVLTGPLHSAVTTVLIMANAKMADGGDVQPVIFPSSTGTMPKIENSLAPVVLLQVPSEPPPRPDSRYRLLIPPHH